MGPDLEMKEQSKSATDVSVKKENGSVPQEGQNQEDKLVLCASNCEDNNFDVGSALCCPVITHGENDDVDINITEHIESADNGPVEAKFEDVPESSSSFGDTFSGGEDDSTSTDSEAESLIHGNATASILGGFGGASQLRRKKLTDQWRNFIRPVMWRCKWLELRIQQIQSKASKYDRELAKYDEAKQVEYEKFTSDDCGVKSVPFSSEIRRKVMKRKKRKRVEDVINVASYMSGHRLFSFYEKNKSAADAASLLDCGNLVTSADRIAHGNEEFGLNAFEFPNSSESLEEILWKIEMVQSQVRRLKMRVDKVVSENPGKFSSINKLSTLVPCDALTTSDEGPGSQGNRDRMRFRSIYASSQNRSEHMIGNLMPESAVSSGVKVTPLPDMIGMTDQPHIGGSKKKSEGEILVRKAKEELQHAGSFENQPPQAPKEEKSSSSPSPISETKLPIRTSVPSMESNDGNSKPASTSNVQQAPRRQGRQRRPKRRFSP